MDTSVIKTRYLHTETGEKIKVFIGVWFEKEYLEEVPRHGLKIETDTNCLGFSLWWRPFIINFQA